MAVPSLARTLIVLVAGPSIAAAEKLAVAPTASSNSPSLSRSHANVTVSPSASVPVAVTVTEPPSATVYGPPASAVGACSSCTPTMTGSWSDDRYGPGS